MTQPVANYGLSLFGIDPYGSEYGSFGVASAVAYTNTTAQVRFSEVIDLSDADFLNPANYTLSPPLAVYAVIIESADSVILATAPQQLIEYTVTVTAGRSYTHIPLDSRYNTATFIGLPQLPTYFPCGTSSTRVRCVFNTEMQVGPATTVGNYTVADLNGNPLSIVNVTAEQPGNPISVVLTLAAPGMMTTGWYQTLLSDNIKSALGYNLDPLVHTFQWVTPIQTTTVDIRDFSGEVQGGPFGNPAGLVYFSPSLNVAASNSIIQVEEVDVCSTAYDTYSFPQPIDPSPFYVWSPTAPQTMLGQAGIVLFGGFPKLCDASFDLELVGENFSDLMPEANDGSCSILMRAGFAPGYVALLNIPTWALFDGNPAHETTPPMFICANITSGPIPPGGEQIIILHCAMNGGSTMTAISGPSQHSAETAIEGISTMFTSPQATAQVGATSWMRVARGSQNHSAEVSIVGTSTATT